MTGQAPSSRGRIRAVMRHILLGLGAALIAVQFVRPARNLAAGPGPDDINVRYPVPVDVQAVLKRACYDCHSNTTSYPWYAEVQPVRWWLDSHIADGRRHLNFSEFGAYTAKRGARKAEEIADEVEHREMPLKSYTWMHSEARLTPAEIKLVVDWANGLLDQMGAP